LKGFKENKMAGIKEVVEILKSSKYAVAFTGAGISVESGIPPFRGEGGVWEKYGEEMFDINYFNAHKQDCWNMLCDGFYTSTLNAKPNAAHIVLAKMEKAGLIKSVITQNIDELHSKAGSKKVYQLHGRAMDLVCQKCGQNYNVADFDLKSAPKCKKCGQILKPAFVFFGESLPEYDFSHANADCLKCDTMILIGSTGVVYPAAGFPTLAKQNGAEIIEINPHESAFTNSITDIFIKKPASQALLEIADGLNLS
jgi:NAD-dependent deacetylase